MSPVFVFVKYPSPYAFLVHWGVFFKYGVHFFFLFTVREHWNYISLHIFFLSNIGLYLF